QEIVSIGIPIVLPDGRVLRGPESKIPPVASENEVFEVTPEAFEAWVHAGFVDLREPNMALWKERFERIEAEIVAIPSADSSSRHLRDGELWSAEGSIQPGRVVGWISAPEERGGGMK